MIEEGKEEEENGFVGIRDVLTMMMMRRRGGFEDDYDDDDNDADKRNRKQKNKIKKVIIWMVRILGG